MIERIIALCLHRRTIVWAVFLFVAVYGCISFREMPLEAYPDIANTSAQLITKVPGLAAEDVEQQITIPVELAIGGLPGLENVRSISKFGLSQVVATFDDDTSIFRARQLVTERLQSCELPAGIERPQLGPISTGPPSRPDYFRIRPAPARRRLTVGGAARA